jgi:TDG/mug DNA glycosylase family protein
MRRCTRQKRVPAARGLARVGLQKVPFGGSHAWVLPNPSGLNAHYQPADLARLFRDLRLWATAQHERRGKNRSTKRLMAFVDVTS